MLAALVLALPAAAAAQGAGDEQYRDPFAGQQPDGSQPESGSGTEAAPAGGSAGATTETEAPEASTAQATTPGAELPRTGSEAVLLLLGYGWALLVGGAALRRIA
jgi:hypothetical protein